MGKWQELPGELPDLGRRIIVVVLDSRKPVHAYLYAGIVNFESEQDIRAEHKKYELEEWGEELPTDHEYYEYLSFVENGDVLTMTPNSDDETRTFVNHLARYYLSEPELMSGHELDFDIFAPWESDGLIWRYAD